VQQSGLSGSIMWRISRLIDDQELQRVRNSYDVLWRDADAKPKRCLIGCPHLSQRQIRWWTDRVSEELEAKGKKRVNLETVLFAAPDVIRIFQKDRIAFEKLKATGLKLSPICIEGFMTNPLVADDPIITNSNKLRAYTTARFYLDEEILEIITNDGWQGNRTHE
jgi:predicted aconitase